MTTMKIIWISAQKNESIFTETPATLQRSNALSINQSTIPLCLSISFYINH